MEEQIFALLALVPKGKVVTYGQIAQCLGNRHLCRYVGNVLHRNPDPEKNHCYKVVNSRGRLAENFAFGGTQGQAERLAAEGIQVKNGSVPLAKYGCNLQELLIYRQKCAIIPRETQ